MDEERKVTFDLKYELGHSYEETWVDDHEVEHCPKCGSTRIWTNPSSGDCETPPSYLCEDCGTDFGLVFWHHDDNWQTQQRLEAIRAFTGAIAKPQDPILEAMKARYPNAKWYVPMKRPYRITGNQHTCGKVDFANRDRIETENRTYWIVSGQCHKCGMVFFAPSAEEF
jgi:predicted RNA-binding Zn-ribbon protein involved in translation (DUF1610 family)